MQHVSSFTTVSPAARKAAALAAYDSAVMAPAAADWQTVAHMLRASMPAARAKLEESDAVPSWFVDYALPKAFRKESLPVTFADGVTVRCGLHTALRKAPRIAAACRVAIEFYRCQTGRSAVPEMTSLRVVGSGAEFDPAECSRLTRELRAVAPLARPWAPAPSPSWSHHAAETPVQRAERMFGGRWYLAADGNVMRSHTAPTFEPVEWEFSDEAPSRLAKQWAAAWAQADAQRWREDWEAQQQAGWCEAVAGAYADPVETEIAETIEPGALIPAVTIVRPDLNVHPAVGIAKPIPTVEIRAEAGAESALVLPIAEQSQYLEAVTNDMLATHTVTAVCLSPKAKAALFERIMDGTFSAGPATAKGGAWRITVQDARDCADIPSVRWVGLPRKPYTRRDASLAVAA